jgi:hypothetical protein
MNIFQQLLICSFLDEYLQIEEIFVEEIYLNNKDLITEILI